jgi:hypothetical protein
MLVIAVAISSHALYDGIRFTLDRLFFQEQFRQLRSNLRTLAREAGAGQRLPERLQAVLTSLCRALGISKGFVALRHKEGFVVQATRGVRLEGRSLPRAALSAAEIVHLPRSGSPIPEDMVLLVPLCADGAQVGALVLGAQDSDQPFGEEELDLIDDLADQIAHIIHTSQLQDNNARTLNALVAEFRERERLLQQQVQRMLAERDVETRVVLDGTSPKQFRSLVEEGLRRLHDYPYLGEHALSQLHIVNLQLEGRDDEFLTHIERGKALNDVLLQALGKLRPAGPEPPSHQVPPREWYQFLILHDAYVSGCLIRDIMSRLYVSEGTFNRTRRRAIRGVARALQEMEQEARKRMLSA